MKLTIIAAMDENRLIGTGQGGLPWEGLRRDVEHFRAFTADKALLLGRSTYEEMLGWFKPGHRPIVVTRDECYQPGGGHPAVGSVKEALELATGLGEEQLVVCGGASIYRLALPLADELILTRVHAAFEAPAGGVYFPDWGAGEFQQLECERFEADAENAYPMSKLRLARSAGDH